MAGFTTEAAVRVEFQVADTVTAPAELIESSIERAHAELLRYLDASYGAEPIPDLLVAGETFLAGAELFRSLAAKDALTHKELTVGGQRISGRGRFESLLAIAAAAESTGWELVAPYLAGRPTRGVLAVSDSMPLLGEHER